MDRRTTAVSENILGMSLVRFLNSVRKHWWALMSCAAFTLLGMWVLYANKSNAWTFQATFGLAGFCLFWACFLAWRDEEKKVKEFEAALAEVRLQSKAVTEQHIHLPPPPAPTAEPLKHNVQCLDVTIEDSTVTIGFQNVLIPGKPIGDFRNARLRVEYRLEATDKEWDTIFPARWACYEQDDIPIGVVPQHAFLASYYDTDKEWYALSTADRTRLPIGGLKIKATLIGEGNLSLPPITGVLTLGEGGSASFVRA
jgi:hypothetical protein